MDTLQMVIGTIVVLVGVWIGGQVAKKSGFIYPWDFVTLSIVILSVIYTTLYVAGELTVIDPIWLIPFYLGYVVGYSLIGLSSYMMVNYQSYRHKRVITEPWVVWPKGEDYVLIEQSNRALWNRWVHKVHHNLTTNEPLEADWTGTHKQPAFPTFNNRVIYLDYVSQPEYRIVKKGKLREIREYSTSVLVARASYESKAVLGEEEGFVLYLQRHVFELERTIHRMELEQGLKVMEMAMNMDLMADRTSPANRAYALMELKAEFKKKSENVVQTEADLIQKEEQVQKKEDEKLEVINAVTTGNNTAEA